MTTMTDHETEPTPGATESFEELGTYGSLQEARDVVARLSSAGVPAEDLRIVGTDLTTVERAETRRSTKPRAAGLGALGGLWSGLLVGLLFAMFTPVFPSVALLWSMVLFAVGGAVFGLVGSSFLDGHRDGPAPRRVLADRFAVLVRVSRAAHAREAVVGA
ncbi:general stress protein [Actinomycetospora sp. TBRC 11914]|uniref:general stress protein n=1 Tax=Actinomycetospora sp. TBRC 11914 TaxID=2729387 RepID=UPI00145E3A16|nr:general stress protein [Actinomycetospora sp. TBRC 11914]NMO91705.1 hypothetical protein [Actinomycetospora sp. TBRC 11914]